MVPFAPFLSGCAAIGVHRFRAREISGKTVKYAPLIADLKISIPYDDDQSHSFDKLNLCKYYPPCMTLL
jgi:hypothetical protein